MKLPEVVLSEQFQWIIVIQTSAVVVVVAAVAAAGITTNSSKKYPNSINHDAKLNDRK